MDASVFIHLFRHHCAIDYLRTYGEITQDAFDRYYAEVRRVPAKLKVRGCSLVPTFTYHYVRCLEQIFEDMKKAQDIKSAELKRNVRSDILLYL